ncbi:MAG TPA: hypothetical protein VJT10_17005 [Steroidobacteraceae bacterium]|nr:hypothetical protein [Steroidobacteraceae bacterium]
MDPLTQLYQRLREQVPGPRIPIEPPAIEECESQMITQNRSIQATLD